MIRNNWENKWIKGRGYIWIGEYFTMKFFLLISNMCICGSLFKHSKPVECTGYAYRSWNFTAWAGAFNMFLNVSGSQLHHF